jgi:hypothetical protein
MDGGDRIVRIGENMIALSYDLASSVFVDMT